MKVLAAMQMPLWEAHKLALAEPVSASHDVPPFTNSAMDGFAVRGEDVAAVPTVLRVLEDVPAGSVPSSRVGPGSAIKIMTGAPIPEGADTVVRVEDTEAANGQVRVLVTTPLGTAVRPAGGDLVAGAEVFPAGTRLTPRHLAVLASLGITPVVNKRPRVAVLSTGDEVQPPETANLAPGQIRDTNRPLLIGLLKEMGVEVFDLGIVGDHPQHLRTALAEGASQSDMVITSGGVSMGEYDLVKAILGEMGSVDFWQVAMQPAKPFAFGHIDKIPLLGLPGNPVSVMVAFEQFARPALLCMMGSKALFRPQIPARVGQEWSTDPQKTVFTRVVSEVREGVLYARPSGGQMSNILSALAGADAFAVIPVGVGQVEAGDTITLELFTAPESRTAEEVFNV